VSLPRIVVERELGASALGYFAALAYLVVAGRMVAIALGSAAVPRLGRYFASRDRTAFIRALLGLVAFGASLGAVGVLGAVALGEPVLGLVYGADYTRYTSLLTWLMVAAGFGYVSIYLQDALTTMRSLAPKALLLAGGRGHVRIPRPLAGTTVGARRGGHGRVRRGGDRGARQRAPGGRRDATRLSDDGRD
jgi:O-antigen/teichoic acid export membrane protein